MGYTAEYGVYPPQMEEAQMVSINFDTVRFISALNQLAESSKHGCMSRAQLTQGWPVHNTPPTHSRFYGLIYDETRPMFDDDNEWQQAFPITMDNMGRLPSEFEGFEVFIVFEDDSPPYIVVRSKSNPDSFCVIIKDGTWQAV